MLRVERMRIEQLSADPANARKHSDRNIDAIIASLRRFGQQKPIVVDLKGVVRAGNGTLEAAKKLGWEVIDCVMTSLEGSDAVAYAIADNRTAELAEWDDDALTAQLTALLTEDNELAIASGFSVDEIESLMDSNQELLDLDNPYTAKIVSPIYEPRGERPKANELYDRSKADSLIKGIKEAKLGDDVERFLVVASERHVAFDFRQIAEFYSHASKEVQDLMERNGLVVIDFKKAIEYGFVHLTQRLGALVDIEEDESDA